LRRAEAWRLRLRTARAMAFLCQARLLIAWVPFERWRGSLGSGEQVHSDPGLVEARRLAAHVQRAADLLPFPTRCLPRAMALSWMLRREAIGHSTVIAVRPPDLRNAHDDLHAWVEVNGVTILGELPGPWVVMLRLGP
jgi:hypothetical protein